MPHGKQESKEEVVALNCVCSELNGVPKLVSCLPRVGFWVVSDSDYFIFVTSTKYTALLFLDQASLFPDIEQM